MESDNLVIKYSGERVPFEVEKLRKSLSDAGASEGTVANISDQVSKSIYDGITTKEIYRHAHLLLKKQERSRASRFNLKKAIQNLGPTGYPFELFIGALMEKEGFQPEIGVVKPGSCVTHEVDVWATNSSTVRIMECKFHNRPGYKTDVKVPLYIKSRFEDLVANKDARDTRKYEGWVVTNSRFTEDAIRFGECSGLHLFSWDYPNNYSLKMLTRKHLLYPITTLSGLTRKQMQQLMDGGVILVETLCNQPELIKEIEISSHKVNGVLKEAELVCQL